MQFLRPTLQESSAEHWSLDWRIDSLDSSRRRCLCSRTGGTERFTHFGKLFIGALDSPEHDRFCRQAVVGLQQVSPAFLRPMGGRLECELPVIVYPRLEVQTLDEWLDVTGQPVVARCSVVEQIIASVADLHEAGVVHGALKPEHVLIDRRDQVRVVGLGNLEWGDEEAVQRGVLGRAARATTASDMRGLARLMSLLIGRQFLATPLGRAMQSPDAGCPTARQLHTLMQKSGQEPGRRAA